MQSSFRASSLVLSLSLVLLAPTSEAGELKMTFLNVDQGNATFIQGPDGTAVLIDAGIAGKGTGVIRPYLQSIGVTDLDYSIATHWDNDHWGGMAELFNGGYKPNVAAYDGGNSLIPSSGSVTTYLSSVSGVRATPSVGTTIPLGDGAFLEIVAINGQHPTGSVNISSSAQEDNSASIASVIHYGDFQAYIAGDLTSGGNGTSNVEGPVSAWVGQVEVAQASHHGSNTSSGTPVINNLDPSFVVQSAGLNNPFFHPTETTIKNWNSPSAARVQWCTTEGDTDNGSGGFTAINGHIELVTDGTLFEVQREGGSERLRFLTFENPGLTPVAGSFAFSETLPNPAEVSDTYGEWFEVTGLAASPVDLGQVDFECGNYGFVLKSRILLSQYEKLTFGKDGRRSRNGDVFTSMGTPWESFFMNNTSATLAATAPGNVLVDSISWGSGQIPVTAGVSQERVDLFGDGSAANFAPATSPFGDGDLGSPLDWNGGDATDYPITLAFYPPPTLGGQLTVLLNAPDEAASLYVLRLSGGFSPGFDYGGFHIPLNVDGIFQASTSVPEFLSMLDSEGFRQIVLPLNSAPALSGLSAFANMLTFSLQGQSFQLEGQSNLAFFTIQ